MGNGIIKYLLESVLSVIYSRDDNCLICNTYCVDEELICPNCLNKIEFYNSSFKIKRENLELECFSATYYTKVTMELIRRLKYKSDFYAGEFLGSLLIKLIINKNIEYDLVSYIPMTKKALKNRGFNQSKFLASIVASNFNKPTKELLIKARDTRDQIGLDATSRWENLNSCYKIIDKKLIKNRKILLIDDVITTGATTFYCAEELINNGVEKVTVLTVAKSKL